MDKDTFLRLLSVEVADYKALLETQQSDWVVKGFIDIDKNVYTITNDTKVVSKIIEIILIPKLQLFAIKNGLSLELPTAQNYYPDLTFKDKEGNLFAVDFKSSYYENKKINGLTLGSYWGYFRNRNQCKNTNHPYSAYQCHLVIGMLYRQSVVDENKKTVYGIEELAQIHSVIEKFIFFVQPKWKIASDRPGSGNTRNIGGILEIEKLINGEGPFAPLGEEVFDHYWINFYNASDARNAGIGKPHYYNLHTYQDYLNKQKTILDKITK